MRGMNRNLAIAFALLISLGYPAKSGAVDFAPPKSYPVGTSPSGVVVGDFNGDGKPDLAVANSGSANVSVLLANGDGTFQSAVNFDAGLSPGSVAVGDFNGDGKLDLAVFQQGDSANGVAGAVSILFGNGDGRFQVAKTTALMAQAASMTVGDFNSDTKSDIVIGNIDPATVDLTLDLFIGNGDGTFLAPRVLSTLSNGTQALLAADLNGDGKLDLAVGISSGVNILLGKGDGTIQQAPSGIVATAFAPFSIRAADLTGSGKQDLIVELFFNTGPPPGCRAFCFNLEISALGTYLGNGDGSFQAGQRVFSLVRSGGGVGPRSYAVGDYNGDRKFDLVFANTTGMLLGVLGRGTGTFSSPLSLDVASGSVASAADLNGDGLSDLLALGPGNAISVFLNTGPTSGADLGTIQAGASPEPVGVGSSLTYTADVLNQGPQDATGVIFTDTLPNNVNFVSATASQGSCVQSHGIVSCTLGSLASAFDTHVTILVTPTAAGTITNSMNVSANESDLALANNSATQITTVVPAFTLTVVKTGNGSGTIQSNSTIDCGTTCSATFLSGTLVSLSAVPSASSTFSNWSGACTGTDPNVCSVTLNSDQSVTATFTTPPDFTLTPAAMSLTLKRGGQVSEVLTFPAQGGFSGTIALACSVSGPSPMPTCGISPASVTPGTNATLTVNAAALSASLTAPWFERGARLYGAWLPLVLLGCVLATSFDKKRRRHWALCLLMLVATILPVGCSSSSVHTTPPQTYMVTVTATSGTLQHSTTVLVTVN